MGQQLQKCEDKMNPVNMMCIVASGNQFKYSYVKFNVESEKNQK